MTSYFCHQCRCQKQSSDVSLENSNLTCKSCGSDFVEEIAAESGQDFPDNGASQSDSTQQGAVGGFDFFGGHSLQDDPLLRPLPHYRPPQPQQQAALEGELFGTMPVFRLGLNRMFHLLDTRALDHVMTQLLSQVDNAGAPPPATERELARIRKVAISAEQVSSGMQCNVCLDEFKEGDMTEMLPCEHHFHSQCIRPWLDRRGTCPVCRKPLSLPGDQETSAAAVSGAEAMAEAIFPEMTHYGAYAFSQAPAATGHGPSAPGGRGGGRRGAGSGGGHDSFVEDACD